MEGGSRLLKPTPPSSAGILGSKLETLGWLCWGKRMLERLLLQHPEGWGGETSPGPLQSTPNSGGGCLGVKGKSQAWVTPECSAPPLPSAGAPGPQRICIDGYRGSGCSWGGGLCFLVGFYLCFKGWVQKKGGKPNSNSPTALPVPWGAGTGRAPRPPNCMRVKRPGRSFPLPSLCPKHQLELQLGGFKSINKTKRQKTPQSVPPLSLFLCGAGAGWGGQGASGPTSPQRSGFARPRRKERTKPHLAACTLLWFS